jgi:hypothetical protein
MASFSLALSRVWSKEGYMATKSTVVAVFLCLATSGALNLRGWAISSTDSMNQHRFGLPLRHPSSSFFFRVSMICVSNPTNSFPTPAIDPPGFLFVFSSSFSSPFSFLTPLIHLKFLLADFHIP